MVFAFAWTDDTSYFAIYDEVMEDIVDLYETDYLFGNETYGDVIELSDDEDPDNTMYVYVPKINQIHMYVKITDIQKYVKEMSDWIDDMLRDTTRFGQKKKMNKIIPILNRLKNTYCKGETNDRQSVSDQ